MPPPRRPVYTEAGNREMERLPPTPTSQLSLDEICWRLSDYRKRGKLSAQEIRFSFSFYNQVRAGSETERGVHYARTIVHEIRNGRCFLGEQEMIDRSDAG